MPRTSREQALAGLEIPKDPSAMVPGDLLYFGRSEARISHIGIYIGDGKYVHAANRRQGIIVSEVPTGTRARNRAPSTPRPALPDTVPERKTSWRLREISRNRLQ